MISYRTARPYSRNRQPRLLITSINYWMMRQVGSILRNLSKKLRTLNVRINMSRNTCNPFPHRLHCRHHMSSILTLYQGDIDAEHN